MPSSPNRTILCVDDEDSILRSLRRLLRTQQWTVLLATNGAEALEVLAREEVAVILADQRMPGMTGVELLRRSRELYPETLRVMISGFAELHSVVDAVNEGEINRFIGKPWDDEVVLETVRRCFAQHDLAVMTHDFEDQLREQNERLQNLADDLALRNQALLVHQEILEELPISVIGIDGSGTIALANRSARRHLTADEPSIGVHFAEILPAALAEAVSAAFAGEGTTKLALLPPTGRGAWSVQVAPLRPSASQRGVLLLVDAACDGASP